MWRRWSFRIIQETQLTELTLFVEVKLSSWVESVDNILGPKGQPMRQGGYGIYSETPNSGPFYSGPF